MSVLDAIQRSVKNATLFALLFARLYLVCVVSLSNINLDLHRITSDLDSKNTLKKYVRIDWDTAEILCEKWNQIKYCTVNKLDSLSINNFVLAVDSSTTAIFLAWAFIHALKPESLQNFAGIAPAYGAVSP